MNTGRYRWDLAKKKFVQRRSLNKAFRLDNANKTIKRYEKWYGFKNIEDSMIYKNQYKADIDRGFQSINPDIDKTLQRIRQRTR